jgi:hypothetical protein
MPGIAEVLRGVVQAVRAHPKGEKVVITADGGIRTGFDVLKMLALGADLVLFGRPLARELVPHGAAGVKRLLEFIAGDIRKAMMMTSCRLVDEIDERILSRYPASQGILPLKVSCLGMSLKTGFRIDHANGLDLSAHLRILPMYENERCNLALFYADPNSARLGPGDHGTFTRQWPGRFQRSRKCFRWINYFGRACTFSPHRDDHEVPCLHVRTRSPRPRRFTNTERDSCQPAPPG